MESGASFATLDLDAGERFVRLRQTLGVESFGLNLMLLEPGERGRVHRHKRQEEVYNMDWDDTEGKPPQDVPLPPDL